MKPAVIVTNFGRTLVVGHSTIPPGPVSEKAIEHSTVPVLPSVRRLKEDWVTNDFGGRS